MGNLIVPVNDQLCATLKIGTDDFPFQLFHDDLKNFVKGFVNWHKQKEIEISYVLEGSIRVCLLQETHTLSAGDAFLIFPQRLHSIQPAEHPHSRYFTLIFDPCLLTGFSESFFDREYYAPFSASGQGYYQIPGETKLQEVFTGLAWFYKNVSTDTTLISPAEKLTIQRTLQDIWVKLSEALFQADICPARTNEETRLLLMIDYLRKNYAEKFSLTHMADSLYISRGECCRFFKKMMGMTISEYLSDYRLGQASELLKTTSMTITEIAHTVGFNSVSNFQHYLKKKRDILPGYIGIPFRAADAFGGRRLHLHSGTL